MMNETLTRLFHRLTLLSEAESEDPEFSLIPVHQRKLSRSSFQRLTSQEQEEYRPGSVLYHIRVDAEDFERVQQHVWREDPQGYIYTTGSVRNLYLGSFILQSGRRTNQRRRSTEEDKRDFRRRNLYTYGPQQEVERQAVQRRQTRNRIPVYARSRPQIDEEPLYSVLVDPRDVNRVRQHHWRERQTQHGRTIISSINRRDVGLGAFILETNDQVHQVQSTGDSQYDFRRINLRTRADRVFLSRRTVSHATGPNSIPIYPQRRTAAELQQMTPEAQALYQPQLVLYYVEVNPEDMIRVQEYTWREYDDEQIYAEIRIGRLTHLVSLGQFILQTESPVRQQRLNRWHTLNFRRSNLRTL